MQFMIQEQLLTILRAAQLTNSKPGNILIVVEEVFGLKILQDMKTLEYFTSQIKNIGSLLSLTNLRGFLLNIQ